MKHFIFPHRTGVIALALLALTVLSTLNSQLSTALAQNIAFTYQGRVQVGGTDFSGTGQFKFALVTSTNISRQATATANLSGQFVISYSVTFAGNGYVSAPAVTVSGGGGSGATAHAVLSGGMVTSVEPDSAGSGYTSPPMVTIAPPPPNISFTTFWSNDGTSVAGSEPAAAVSVPVSNGLFAVVIGDTTLANMAPLPASVFFEPKLQLQIWFSDGVNPFAALNPPQDLTPTPYAINAASLSGLLSASQVTGALASANLSGVYSGAVNFNNTSNSFSGSFTGEMRLNDSNLWLRGGSDTNSGLGWYGGGKPFNDFSQPAPDGPVLFGFAGGGLGTTTNGQRVALAWDASQRVGIGTVTPGARLSLGGEEARSKLLVFDGGSGAGAGFGYSNGQFRLHLPNSFSRFVFLDAPNGNEILTVGRGGISGGTVGIGTTFPESRLHVTGDIRLGSSGELFAPGGTENLRILRGRIAGNGTITTGRGFTVTKTGTGAYTVTFLVAFASEPTITATPQVALARIATCTNVGAGSAQFRTWDSAGGAAVDQDFHFIAIGLR